MLGFSAREEAIIADSKEVIIKFTDRIKELVEILREKKAEGIRVLDMREIDGVITDGFIICSAGSERQVRAIAEHLRISLKERGETIKHVEGTALNHWVLLDTGDIIVHVFLERIREFYRLENLWVNAIVVETPDHES